MPPLTASTEADAAGLRRQAAAARAVRAGPLARARALADLRRESSFGHGLAAAAEAAARGALKTSGCVDTLWCAATAHARCRLS